MQREGPRMISLALISLDLQEAREACDAVEGLGRRVLKRMFLICC